MKEFRMSYFEKKEIKKILETMWNDTAPRPDKKIFGKNFLAVDEILNPLPP